MTPLESPAALMFEVVVTIGVAAWAWSLAGASGQSSLRWGALTMAGAFAVHRLAAWLVPMTTDPNDVFTGAGQVWRIIAPFMGTIVVFVAAPIVVTMTMPQVPRRKRP